MDSTVSKARLSRGSLKRGVADDLGRWRDRSWAVVWVGKREPGEGGQVRTWELGERGF